MANDLYIIKELEKTIRKKLEPRSLGTITRYDSQGYVLDGEDFVIGLNLYACNIADLSFLTPLTRLTRLQLGNNKISDVSFLQGLTALTHLRLSSNQLTDVSPLQGLSALKGLGLSSNQLTDISPLKGLTALTELNLHSNQLTNISPLKGLTALTELNLYSNQLTDISPLQGLTALTGLNLNSNQLTDVSPLKGLTALTTLVLSSNQLTDVSPLQGLTALEYLFLDDNPLEIPPIEVANQGAKAVLNYLKELEKESVRLLQCKLLIVGNGEVGKTTLMKKLIKNKFKVKEGKEKTTHGINIEPWKLDVSFKETENESVIHPVNLHFWDFGGQDIYHATHQFFLTKRSLYLFVWEVRREDETRSFDYWLNILKLLSAESPVIMVMNKSDLRGKCIDEASFQAKFPNIQSFCQISCLKGDGIKELTEEIRRNLSAMPHLRDKLPRVWVQIRDRLLKEKKKKNYITLTEYFSICQEYGLNQERAEFVSGYLHDLGAILHYQEDPLLAETVILNPEWTTEAVYILIDTREIQNNLGNFRFDDLKKFWDNKKYPRDKHLHLARLMEKFELCFNFANTDLYFVPELLAPQKKGMDLSLFQQPGVLRFQYHYDFMPEGIVSRFMARLFYLIDDKKFWKNGVILTFEDSTALITGEPLNRRVTITITGKCQRELLSIIRSHFDHIHTTLNMQKNNHYHEMVPCICPQCQQSDTPNFYKYEVIKKALANGVMRMPCLDSYQEVSLAELLALVAPPKPKHDVIETLITATSQLQGIAKTIKEDEDSRNGFIALLLNIQGYRAKDQTRWGRSASGKSAGEVDIKIESTDGRAETIIEAFNLKGLHCDTIDLHLQKVFAYDPNGLEHIFILVYAENKDFAGLWEKYLAHFADINFEYPLIAPPQTVPTRMSEIKVAHALHRREKEEVVVHHIFVNMFRA